MNPREQYERRARQLIKASIQRPLKLKAFCDGPSCFKSFHPQDGILSNNDKLYCSTECKEEDFEEEELELRAPIYYEEIDSFYLDNWDGHEI